MWLVKNFKYFLLGLSCVIFSKIFFNFGMLNIFFYLYLLYLNIFKFLCMYLVWFLYFIKLCFKFLVIKLVMLLLLNKFKIKLFLWELVFIMCLMSVLGLMLGCLGLRILFFFFLICFCEVIFYILRYNLFLGLGN